MKALTFDTLNLKRHNYKNTNKHRTYIDPTQNRPIYVVLHKSSVTPFFKPPQLKRKRKFK